MKYAFLNLLPCFPHCPLQDFWNADYFMVFLCTTNNPAGDLYREKLKQNEIHYRKSSLVIVFCNGMLCFTTVPVLV